MVNEDTEAEIERYAEQCVLYILSQHQRNETIKRNDLVKAVLPEHLRRSAKSILTSAQEMLKAIYGLKFIELNDSVKQYMVVNAIEAEDPPLLWSDEIKKQQALLLPLLSYIFMNGGTASENEIKTLLRKFKIIKDLTYESELFNDLEKVLKKDFVCQRYLRYQQTGMQSNEEEAEFEFSWGTRAELEVGKEKILKFVSDLYGVEMTHWADQYAQLRR